MQLLNEPNLCVRNGDIARSASPTPTPSATSRSLDRGSRYTSRRYDKLSSHYYGQSHKNTSEEGGTTTKLLRPTPCAHQFLVALRPKDAYWR